MAFGCIWVYPLAAILVLKGTRVPDPANSLSRVGLIDSRPSLFKYLFTVDHTTLVGLDKSRDLTTLKKLKST